MDPITLIALGLKIGMPWLIKKLGGKKKLKKAIEVAIDLFQQASDLYTSEQGLDRKRFVMGELAKDPSWQKLGEGEQDTLMEYSYRAWKGSLSPTQDDDDGQFEYKIRVALEALRVHGHNEIATGLAEELGQ